MRLAKFTDVNRYLLSALALAGLCFLYIPRASAQAHHAVEDKGFTAFEEFRGTTSTCVGPCGLTSLNASTRSSS